MARPKKQTVDYFPHKCTQGRVMFILEQEFKNDGYAFRYKLQEVLGLTENHVLDCRDVPTWKFLQAKTLCSEDICNKILDLLADLGEIDKELWGHRIVWSGNFMADIADAYLNRRVETPSKPSFYDGKLQIDGISTDDNPQRKGKERIEKDRIGKETLIPVFEIVKDYFVLNGKFVTELQLEQSVTRFYENLKNKPQEEWEGYAKNWLDNQKYGPAQAVDVPARKRTEI